MVFVYKGQNAHAITKDDYPVNGGSTIGQLGYVLA
jgi:hypothetical protein